MVISATGLWAHGLTALYGPDGTNQIAGSAAWLPGANLGALIGRIDKSAPFVVGSNKSFTSNYTGTLQLMLNDDVNRSNDNQGAINVKIIRKPK